MNDATHPAAAAPAPLGRRVLQTFLAPADLFRASRGYAPWMGPVLLSTLVAMVAVLAIPDQAFELTEPPVNRRGRPVEVTSGLETIALYGRMLRMLSALAMHPLIVLAAAGVLALLFSVLLRGEARYLQYLSIAAHASLVAALGTLVAAVVALLRGAEPRGITPALLPLAAPDGFAYRLLEGLDLFTLWALLVAALGVSLVNRRRSFASAAALLLGVYVALVVGVAALGT
ncbi:MAG: YIP1 family protein [Longimicrobiaceae bacterium]